MTKKKEDVVWYKVVNQQRRSVIVDRNGTEDTVIDALALTYNKGKIVKSKHGSYGCFCFTDYTEATCFSEYEKGSFIIKVRPVGTIKQVPKRIPVLLFYNLFYIKENIKKLKLGQLVSASWPVPAHTVCCTAVEVLD